MELFRNIFHGSHVYSQSLMDSSQSYIKHSATQCAATCRTCPQYNQSWSCNSFLYSETTGLCRIAHSVALLEDLFYQGYGDLYAGCDIGRGYRLYTWGNITACLLLVTSAQNYSNAVTSCHQSQGYLASTKTIEKMNLIQNFSSTDIRSIWVGLSDTVQEGEYIWEEDGSVMTTGQLTQLFNPGEPNNQLMGAEDCGMVYYKNLGLNDDLCFRKFAFMCETKLVVSENPMDSNP
ncbi:hypothetical protein RRG08_031097 [Elysia crispata]|uniref:C-type lectin domain-containing protein n=1 Tax=Elysia crispata TaxID=231223 RepID=A0AAE0ZFE0_9GAST|nr:hypothetical protein RRG08_031097 [Elysia crispata]